MIVDRAVAIRGPHQLPVQAVDPTRVALQAIEDLRAIAQLVKSGIHADHRLVLAVRPDDNAEQIFGQ